MIYVPRDDPRNKHCRKLSRLPETRKTAAQGITLSFDAATVAGYLADVDTVTAALQRIAASMGLELHRICNSRLPAGRLHDPNLARL